MADSPSHIALQGLSTRLLRSLERHLRGAGYAVRSAERSAQAEAAAAGAAAVVVDLRRLPALLAHIPGWREADTARPILVLVGPEGGQQAAIEAGATDFLLEPFTAEDIARRLADRLHPPVPVPTRLALGQRTVDFDRHTITGPEVDHTITPIEAKLLRYLAARPGRALPRGELLQKVWGYRPGTRTRTLTTTIARLRAKLESDLTAPVHIHAVYGVGYRFEVGPRPAPSESRGALLGRTALIASVRSALQRARLVSLLGPPGVGKTRLARAVVAQLTDREVIAVDLTAATTAALAVQAVAAALKLTGRGAPEDAVPASLLGRPGALLVLDNVEQIAAELAPVLAGWLPAAPILVTSRVPLNLTAEVRVQVPPLSPEDAATLYLERARARAPGLAPSPDAVDALVAALDGLPLAIELAAARAPLLSPERLLERLSLDLLTSREVDRPARHRSLRAALAVSWEGLGPAQQALLRRCTVFAGGFDLDAAEMLSESPAEAMEVLQDLVDHQMLQVTHVPTIRFDTLVSVRSFAAEQLDGAEAQHAEAQHGRWYAQLGSLTAEVSRLSGGIALQEELSREEGNLRIAAERAIARGDAPVAVATVCALQQLQSTRGVSLLLEAMVDEVLALQPTPDGIGRLLLWRIGARYRRGDRPGAEADVARAVACTEDPVLRGRILLEHGYLLLQGGAKEQADAVAAQAAPLLAGTPFAGHVPSLQAQLHRIRGQLEQAAALAQDGVRLLRQHGHHRRLALALNGLAIVLGKQGRQHERVAAYEDAIAQARASGDARLAALLLNNLGGSQIRTGQLSGAADRLSQAAATFRRLGVRSLLGSNLHNQGIIARLRGQLPDAIRLLEESVEVSRACGNTRQAAHVRTELLWTRALSLPAPADPDRLRPLLDALAQARQEQLDQRRPLQAMFSAYQLADALWLHGRPADALPHSEAGLSEALSTGSGRFIPGFQSQNAVIQGAISGDLDRAETVVARCNAELEQAGSLWELAESLAGLGLLLLRHGTPARRAAVAAALRQLADRVEMTDQSRPGRILAALEHAGTAHSAGALP